MFGCGNRCQVAAWLSSVLVAFWPTARTEAQGPRCGRISWTAPSRIRAPTENAHRVARWPYAVPRADGILIAGMDAQRFSDTIARADLVLWQLNSDSAATELTGPERNAALVFPRAISGPDAAVDLFWGEGASGPRENFQEATKSQTSLWWARRDSTGRWNDAKRLVDGIGVGWQWASVMFARSANASLVATTARTRTRGEIVELLRFDGIRWSTQELPNSVGGLYPSLAEDIRGEFYVAFVGPDDSGPLGSRAVVVTHSNDAGSTWTEPSVVWRAEASDISELSMVVTSRGTLTLVWLETPNPQTDALPRVRLVASRDHGKTWSTPADLIVPAD